MTPQPWTVHIPHMAPCMVTADSEADAINRACAVLGLAFIPEFATAEPTAPGDGDVLIGA